MQQVQTLQADVANLRRELNAAHQRTHDVTQMYLAAAAQAQAANSYQSAGSSSSSRPGATAGVGSLQPPGAGAGDSYYNKKDESFTWDPESAALEGGVLGTFQPLSGVLRARVPGAGHAAVWPALRNTAGLVDRGTLALYRRPALRGLFVLYFVAVHAAVSAMTMHGCPPAS